jgi:cytochrome c553
MRFIVKFLIVPSVLLAIAVVAGCPPSIPAEYTAADAAKGGVLYDKWWAVTGAEAPTTENALWPTADTNTNERTGADTWRCKECHGWDYKGASGAYSSGSHFTGVAGIFGTALTAQAVFDSIKTTHGYGAEGLADDDIWDLSRFVLEGQMDTDTIITDKLFTGDAAAGATTYASACAGCHGDDGLTAAGHDDFDDYVGKIADDNPWEFLHKVRFGQPGTSMPAQNAILDVTGLNNLGTHAQTLPVEPPVK